MIETPWGIFPNTDSAALAYDDLPSFLPGDLAVLASGGPLLTVLSYCEECGDVEVAWFDDEDMQFATLPEAALIIVGEDDTDDVPRNADGHTLY